MRVHHRFGPTLTCAVVLAGIPASAHAYRTLADRPQFEGSGPVVWSPPEIDYILHSESAPGVSPASLLEIAEPSFGAWSGPDCAQLSFAYGSVTDAPAAPNDSTNTIEWLRMSWSERGFSSDAMATTDLLYERQNGSDWRIVEADIYFNATDYRWSAHSGAADSNVQRSAAGRQHSRPAGGKPTASCVGEDLGMASTTRRCGSLLDSETCGVGLMDGWIAPVIRVTSRRPVTDSFRVGAVEMVSPLIANILDTYVESHQLELLPVMVVGEERPFFLR